MRKIIDTDREETLMKSGKVAELQSCRVAESEHSAVIHYSLFILHSLISVPPYQCQKNISSHSRLSALIRILIILFAIAAYSPLLAQEPDKQREFVYGVNAFTGLEYEGVAYPRSVDTLYLLADIPNIISSRESLVYFWPITNQYQVDWNGLNEIVEGDLEILQNGRMIESLPRTKYVIQYPNGLGTGEAKIYTGQEAEAQYQEFERRRVDFRDRVFDYYEASRTYRNKLQEQLQTSKESGELASEPPPPPEEPAPFIFFSTGVYDGFYINLPAGHYQIRVRRPDDQFVPDSQRTLIIFGPERIGVNYTIVPHDKYTFPEESNDPSQILYARNDAIFYLQPSVEYEYNDFYLTHLTDPQSTQGNIDQWQWLPLLSIETGMLEIVQNRQVMERIERRDYVVRQITGNMLGYEIHDQLTTAEERLRERRPDFAGYAVHVTDDRPSFSVRLVDDDGSVIVGSEREIHLVRTEAAEKFYGLPLLPLMFGIGLGVWRRLRFKRLI